VPSSDPAVLTLVTHGLGVLAANPVWSPNGREVAYLGAGGVYVIDAFTPAAPRQILVSSEVRSLDW
jgi:Tol biopolymer transport system component